MHSDIKHDFETLTNELSQVDLYEQDVLHMIENGKFNASDGYKFSKMIYEVGQEQTLHFKQIFKI